jgi:hypothetical protein
MVVLSRKPKRVKFKLSKKIAIRFFCLFLVVVWFGGFLAAMHARGGEKDTSKGPPPSPHRVAQNIEKQNSVEQLKQEMKAALHKVQEVEKTKAKAVENPHPETDSKPKKKMLRPHWKPNPYGQYVKPEVLVKDNAANQSPLSEQIGDKRHIPEDQVLTAYLEPIDQSQWPIKPLPSRTTTLDDLTKVPFPRLNSCSKLIEQWPVDDYPDEDAFLPWIHDVFPTHDGKFIQFVAQNKNRCHSGTTDEEEAIIEKMRTQTALFEHVPLKRLENGRYRLSSHEDADPESVGTRFICKFKPSGDITFSEFNNDYEWVSYRKAQRRMFDEEGRDNKQIHTSQLLFKCPVPPELQESIQDGSSVVDDWATIFVDVIPVRTPPRYGHPGEFLVPRYEKAAAANRNIQRFDPHSEWGENHILPTLEDSGRWTNIPVCKPSLMEYEPQALENISQKDVVQESEEMPKTHHLVSCLWASAGYTTRGHRFAVNDGQRRLMEWISFNKLLGWDHFYIYDNTAAFTNDTSLQPVADMFPADVTILKWPSKVCNNNPVCLGISGWSST